MVKVQKSATQISFRLSVPKHAGSTDSLLNWRLLTDNQLASTTLLTNRRVAFAGREPFFVFVELKL